MRTPHRLLAVTAAAVGLLAATLSPAAAATTPAPSPTPSATSSDDYTSLSAALMALYAKQSGATLSSYLTSNQLMVQPGSASTTGAVQPGSGAKLVTGSGTGTALTADSTDQLDSQLSQAGYNLDVRNYSSLQDLTKDVIAKSSTADGKLTVASAQWAAQLAAMRTGTLTNPATGQATMPTIPAENLAFGLLMDQAVAKTVKAAPDLFAAAQSAGVGSAGLAQVFSDQLQSAWTETGKSLTTTLPSVCSGAMLAVMATGDSSAADAYQGCNSSCTTGGLYLHDQASKMFGAASLQQGGAAGSSSLASGDLLAMQGWSQSDLLAQNPALVQGLLADDGSAGGAGLCSTAAASSSATLKSALPQVFANLTPAG